MRNKKFLAYLLLRSSEPRGPVAAAPLGFATSLAINKLKIFYGL